MSNLGNFIKVIKNAYNHQLVKVVHDVHNNDKDNLRLADLCVSPTSSFEKWQSKIQ